jgi:hypothetical protein
VRLGGDRGGVIASQAAKGNKASVLVRRATAEKRASDLLPVIKQIRKDGATSLRQIATELNELNIPAVRDGEWSAVQVRRILSAS